MPRASLWATLFLALFLGLVVGALAERRYAGDQGAAERPVSLPSFADTVARVNPAVVQVATLDRVEHPALLELEMLPRGPEWRGDGAGFVVDASGLIVTNEHLVGRSTRIRVRLADGREWPAERLGSDASTDLALLKVAAGRLPIVPLGDSDRLRVGDWVCAIGNPFRFDHSVTVGVVSSKGRKIFDASFDAYIQTDAAINPGNSGGPLINAAGEAVGVSAAVSRQGQGIGFAIPANVVREVLAQLAQHGRVSRGYLGIQLEDLDGDLATLLGVPEAGGAVVLDVLDGRAGAAAGLRRYDVVRRVSGRRVDSTDALIRLISRTPPHSTVTLEVWRDGRPQQLRARLDERQIEAEEKPAVRSPRGPDQAADALGLVVVDVSAAQRGALPGARRGVAVEDVRSLAVGADNLERGDLVLEVNRRATPDRRAYEAVLAELPSGSMAFLYVFRPRAGVSFLAKLQTEAIQEP